MVRLQAEVNNRWESEVPGQATEAKFKTSSGLITGRQQRYQDSCQEQAQGSGQA